MAEFATAFASTMKFEDDPQHPGKVTPEPNRCRARFGINEKFHPELPEEFWTGPADEALAQAEEIELEQYWKPLSLDGVEDQAVASKIFDMGVNMGTHQAGVLAQRAVNFLLSTSVAEPPLARGTQQQLFISGPQSHSAAPRLAEDGAIGPKTLEQINMMDPVDMLRALREFSEGHYRHIAAVNPAQAVNLEGWLRRAAA